MNHIFGNADSYKVSAFPGDWEGAEEKAPLYQDPEPKRCSSCNKIFLPKWHKAKRCDFCRKNKIPYLADTNQNKPF
jgi:hypothetical protein